MTRRSPAEYNWSALEFDETILTKHFTSPRQQKIQFVVVHHMTVLGRGTGSALDACWNIWQTRQASAHYGVDGSLVRQFVWDADAGWSTGSYVGNNGGISIEHANSVVGDGTNWQVADQTWKNGARLAANLHKFYNLGRPTSNGNGTAGTLRAHQSFNATACPGPYLMSIWGSYLAEAQRVYDQITGGTAPAAEVPAPVRTKSISQLADEVLAGQHGSGDARRTALGSNYDAVQAEVNRKLGAQAAPAPAPQPSISDLADAVIRGEFGSGDERRARLGGNFDAVQAEVNRKLGSVAPPRPGLTTIAFQVIAGQWGTGPDRVARLTRAGYNAAAVQAEVNRLL